MRMTGVSLAVGFVLACLTRSSVLGAGQLVRVTPQEISELLANPGMGWQTFHRFANEDRNLEGLPSNSAYFRFYWREVEPQDGQIDFGKFDDLLKRAHAAGQKLAFRIMTTGSGEYLDVPQWLKDQKCAGTEFVYGNGKHWVPDFADSLFQRAHLRLIRELGRRYDGHPDLDLLDIGSVGLWGEWHMSGTEAVETGKPVPLPTVEQRLAIIDAWCNAFPRTPKVILIGSEEGMAQAVQKRYGWRADCLGDMGGFSKTWNHMDHFYQQQIAKTGAKEAWKSAPIAFESCWDMRKWKESGWDVRHIFDYALDCHVSYMNNKSAPIPEGTRPEIERFLRRAGYRLVVRAIEHPRAGAAGSPIPVQIEWENTGVAPPYRDYFVALKLTSKTTPSNAPIITVTENSIRGWLPGRSQTKWPMQIPDSIARDEYDLAIGVVDLHTRKPAVRLGIVGRSPDGWYPVSRIELR